jgi:hypothetical protein
MKIGIISQLAYPTDSDLYSNLISGLSEMDRKNEYVIFFVVKRRDGGIRG